MESRIDIRDFKNVTRFKMMNGVWSKIEENKLKDAQLEFYELDNTLIEDITKNINNGTEIELLYELLPKLTNIDMTISFEEFKQKYEKGSSSFNDLINKFNHYIISEMRNYYNNIKQIQQTVSLVETIKEEIPEFTETIDSKNEVTTKRSKEDIEQEIMNLYEEMKQTTKEKRISILDKINTLEKELSDLNEFNN